MDEAAHPPARHSGAWPDIRQGVWIERLSLTNFRNYADLSLTLNARAVVLTGANGAGKTNLMEAVSLLSPGQGLRRAPYAELARMAGQGDWTIAATVHGLSGHVQIGTGLPARAATATRSTNPTGERIGRIVRIDAENRKAAALAEHIEVVWLTPAMDGLFTGPASERRRFLDRLIQCFDPTFRTRLAQFERAMRQRNRLLETTAPARAQFEGLELLLAQTGVAIAAARVDAVAQIRQTIALRRERTPDSPFPWAELALTGWLEDMLVTSPAVDVEDAYLRRLAQMRERDRAAKRTLVGPHRSDLVVGHGSKQMPAQVCSTGEQKGLLINLVLGHAELVKASRDGAAPVLLLDEIAAHLDAARRAALFADILELGSQAWMTGTDLAPFSALSGMAQFLTVEDAEITTENRQS